jgi:hypothetical protein
VERARFFRSHLGHRKASNPNVRFMSTALKLRGAGQRFGEACRIAAWTRFGSQGACGRVGRHDGGLHR